ncbi:MAG: helix-turn-helix domain-containing protein [Pseudolabrys sp.]|nr:helix-turn-helix domain-containing protein [Pseudolabrys sp.]
MMRVRLKADGRIVEIAADGSEVTLEHKDPAAFVRQVRARCGLTQAAFAEKIEVPIETVRNWEQGKRNPRGPARALLKLIDKAPETAFAALGGRR